MKKLSKAARANIIDQGLDTLRLGDVVIISKQVEGATILLVSGTFERGDKIAPFSMQSTCSKEEDFQTYLCAMLCRLQLQVVQAFESGQDGVTVHQVDVGETNEQGR